jgi:hypothetical protein
MRYPPPHWQDGPSLVRRRKIPVTEWARPMRDRKTELKRFSTLFEDRTAASNMIKSGPPSTAFSAFSVCKSRGGVIFFQPYIGELGGSASVVYASWEGPMITLPRPGAFHERGASGPTFSGHADRDLSGFEKGGTGGHGQTDSASLFTGVPFFTFLFYGNVAPLKNSQTGRFRLFLFLLRIPSRNPCRQNGFA